MHHREIKFVKFWNKINTWEFTDLAVWCTQRSLTLQYDAHCRVWLRGVHHIAEFFETFSFLDSAVWCTPWSLTLWRDAHLGPFYKLEYLGEIENRIRKYLSLFIRALDGFESWKKWRSKISWFTPFNKLLREKSVDRFQGKSQNAKFKVKF